MRHRGAHAVAVPLGCDPPAPEDDKRVGVGGRQRLAHGGRVAVMAAEADVSDVFQRHFEGCRVAGGRNVGGRDEPADVAKTPGAERHLAPVRQRHEPLRRRWKVVHQGVGHSSSSDFFDWRPVLASSSDHFSASLEPDRRSRDKRIAANPHFSGKKAASRGTKRRCCRRATVRHDH
ncbi:MAG: hypothetical protein JWP51_3552 [Bradyrhizobium sp.]|nr:hypothetical protein [Bradyrhizobium sp.]